MPSRHSLKIALPAALVLAAAGLIAWRLLSCRLPDSLFEGRRISTRGNVWTTIGSPRSPDEAFVDLLGNYQPGARRYSIRYYIYDRDERHLCKSDDVHRSLVRGFMPGTNVRWKCAGIEVDTTTFVVDCSEKRRSDVCFSSVDVRNISSRRKHLSLFAAALPYNIPGCMLGSYNIGYDGRSRAVVVDGDVLFSCDREPDSFGALAADQRRFGRLVDVTSCIRTGHLPRANSATAARTNVTSGAARYDVVLEPGERKSFGFRSPMTDSKPGNWAHDPIRCIRYSAAKHRFINDWLGQIRNVSISLPDKRYSDCFKASLAYLIVLSDDGLPRPGSAVYPFFWVRDCAYISDALYCAGRSDLLPSIVNKIPTLQLSDGGFAYKIGARSDAELDATGQAVYMLVQNYRRTRDTRWLSRVWPTILRACEYMRSKRLSNKCTDPTLRGILPPSLSAEDLGRPDHHHYWDDFWTVRGLRDAAFAARELGRGDDAEWIGREADALLVATWSSIRAVARKHGISYIPNGPEDVTSSAMARGTSCGLWPCEVLDPNDPFVRNSFDVYWKKWIAPNGGGFEHKGAFWPYAGLDLAQCYLMLGQPDRTQAILRWTMEHDPTKGFCSWPEGMNKHDLALAAGDMPHGWMCASYILLLSNIFD